jgi:HAE1 family hydrophobic/amphiphilic exporter-1
MGNHSISIGAAGGMLGGVILGLFIIPVLFVVFQGLHERISGKKEVVIEGHKLSEYEPEPVL